MTKNFALSVILSEAKNPGNKRFFSASVGCSPYVGQLWGRTYVFAIRWADTWVCPYACPYTNRNISPTLFHLACMDCSPF